MIRVTPRRKKTTAVLALLASVATWYAASRLGGEFMPTLNKGILLFMPQTLPGLSATRAAELLQTQDRVIKGFPEVEPVFGKAGHALTATDPAPLEMSETIVNPKPEPDGRDFAGDELHSARTAGAAERLRPKMLTVATILAGLLPIPWSRGTGSEVMRRIAAPMVAAWCVQRA